jgi:hypothetical protein
MSAIGNKLRKTQGGLMFFCPACNTSHGITLGRNGWAWNENEDKPTFNPSLYSVKVIEMPLLRRDGRIEYLTDSTHDLRGKSVELPDWPF